MNSLRMDGVLFFPVTPFAADGSVDIATLEQHIATRLTADPGGVFAACGTGELHALSTGEARAVVEAAVRVVGGRVPVVAGAGGSVVDAVAHARGAAQAGADAVLLLPPYLVSGPVEGTIRYVEAILAATDLPVIVYHRANSRYTAAAMAHLAENPQVIGFKDGTGDVAVAQEIVLAVRATGRSDFLFFNGLLTAELSQGAYRGVGIPLYSSAAFAMAPGVAVEHYRAYVRDDEQRRCEILDRFYRPLVRLRDQTPGFGVSLVKAGVRLRGLDVGGVRPPLVDPNPEQLAELARILDEGDRLAGTGAPQLSASAG